MPFYSSSSYAHQHARHYSINAYACVRYYYIDKRFVLMMTSSGVRPMSCIAWCWPVLGWGFPFAREELPRRDVAADGAIAARAMNLYSICDCWADLIYWRRTFWFSWSAQRTGGGSLITWLQIWVNVPTPELPKRAKPSDYIFLSCSSQADCVFFPRSAVKFFSTAARSAGK